MRENKKATGGKGGRGRDRWTRGIAANRGAARGNGGIDRARYVTPPARPPEEWRKLARSQGRGCRFLCSAQRDPISRNLVWCLLKSV